jgi:putative restriction endonuclease
MPDRYFGELPGVPVGTAWASRPDVAKAGVHPPHMAGISGTAADGAESIVVSGGYEDDEDRGDEIIYTGAGGNDPATRKQIADQTLDQPGNAGLVTSQLEGLPVRVVRGSAGDPTYSPVTGFRYDGLYRVAEHWSEVGKSGFRVWRYRLVRLTPQEEAPYLPVDVRLPAGNETPGTSKGVATRIVRTTAVAEAVKKLYDHSCQVCDLRIEVLGGVVAEAAHIRALGRPHHGPDVPGNVLCLCPNHHAAFDQGGIYLADNLRVYDCHGRLLGPLTKVTGHPIDLEQVRYHRRLWGFETPI